MDETTKSYLVELGHAQNDSLTAFTRRMKAGEITTYEPYLQNPETYRNHLFVMVREGVEIDALVALNDLYVIKELIKYGAAKNYYPTWAKEDDWDIQFALASHGYCPEILICSEQLGVRLQVAKKYPEHTEMMLDKVDMTDEQDWYAVFELLMSQVHPEPQLLKQFLKYKKPSWGRLRTLKSKYKVTLVQPDVMEKTMTDYQLFQTGKVLWKRNVSGAGIRSIQYAKKKLPEGLELTEEDFKHLKCIDNTWDVDNYMTKYDEPIECVSGI